MLKKKGIPLRELIDKYAGVVGGWENLQAVFQVVLLPLLSKICDTLR